MTTPPRRADSGAPPRSTPSALSIGLRRPERAIAERDRGRSAIVNRSRSAIALMIVVLVSGLVATLTGSSIAAPSGSQAQGAGCPTFEMVLVPGTNETSSNDDPSNSDHMMLTDLANGLKKNLGNQLQVHTVAYAARAFTDGWLYEDSKKDGVAKAKAELQRLADSCPATKVGIAGYSQGADVAGDVACEIGGSSGPIPATSVVGVALVSDPHQGTDGATAIGNSSKSEGILGKRDCSYGSLSGRVATFCQSGSNPDLYCAASKNSNPVLSGIASLMTTSTDTTTGGASTDGDNTGEPDSAAELAQSMVSDFSNADVSGLSTKVNTLVQQTTSGDMSGAATTASSLLDTLTPLADIVTSATGNPSITANLKSAPSDSAESAAGQLIDNLSKIDLTSAISTVQKIADTALSASGTGARVSPTTSGKASPDIADSANSLATQMAPVTSTPSDVLSSASQVLSVLKPKVIIEQLVNVANGTMSTAANLPQILDAFKRIFDTVTAANLDFWGKVKAVHAICDELNVLFQPLVKMAADVDLSTVSSLIGLIPDTTGVAPIASLVVGILAKVDLVRVANRVGDIQSTAWKFLESCETGCNLAIAGDLIPIALDFATITLNALTTGSKTSTDELGKPDSVTTGLTGSDASLDTVAKQLTSAVSSENAETLSSLVSEGLEAASFYASGSHTSYGTMVVDSSGRTTFQYLVDWFTSQFQKTTGA